MEQLMKRYVYEPTIKKLEKVLPYSIEVPRGFRTHAQSLCNKTLGKSYYSFNPKWQTLWINGQGYIGYRNGWVVYEDAVWQYRDGKLYFKDEGNCVMVTMAMLSKPKRKK